MANLWPEHITNDVQPSPLTILRQQASFLGERTRNIVTAGVHIVQTSQNKGFFQYIFYIIAPTLNNYQYRLFILHQKIEFYPVNITLDDDIVEELRLIGIAGRGYFLVDEKTPLDSGVFVESRNILVCKSEQDFLEALRDIFATQRVAKIIQSLYSQSLSMKGD